MRTAAFIIACVVSISMAPVSARAAAGAGDRLYLTDTTITAHIDHMPIQALLKRIAACGIAVTVDPSISHTVTARISQAPMAEGLRQLFSPLSYSLVWASINTPAGPLSKVTEIHVFQPGSRDKVTSVSGEEAFGVITDPVTGALVVKGELLVRVLPGTDLDALKALLSRYNAVVVDYHPGTGILRLRLPDHALASELAEALANGGTGAVVEPHYAYRLPPLVAQTGGFSQPRRSAGASSAAAPIAILDSGLKTDALPEALILAAYNAISPGADIDDRMGHGTQMALIASGQVAPLGTDAATTAVPVIPVKIFDENGVTSNFTVMRAVTHAMERGAKIISLSWGSETDSAFLGALLAHAAAGGVTLVAASGNAPTGKPMYPAAFPSVIGIGALAPDGSVWESSNRGSFVTLYAAGYAQFDGQTNDNAGLFAGTSVATAYTANRMAAFYSDHPGAGADAFIAGGN